MTSTCPGAPAAQTIVCPGSPPEAYEGMCGHVVDPSLAMQVAHIAVNDTVRSLVVFARFPDGVSGTACDAADWPDPDEVPAWADSLVEEADPDTVGSITHFFDLMSDGDHLVWGRVYPQVVVAAQTIAYYDANYESYEEVWRANMDITRQVIADLGPDILDFDLNGDGFLDHIHIVYRDFESTDGTHAIFDGFNALSEHTAAESTFVVGVDQSIKVDRWTGSCQRPVAFGSVPYYRRSRGAVFDDFKHEYMHQIQNAFGFPLFNLNHIGSSASYGIMDGTYLGNGHYIDGWMLRMLGWLDPIEVDSTVAGGETTITLAAVPNPGSRVLVRTVDPNQHFMLELRNRDLPYAQGHGVAQCGSEAGFSGLLITHVLDEGGQARWGGSTGNAPFFDPEVATGRFDEEGAPDPIAGEDLIHDQQDCWFTARADDLFKPGSVNVFGPFTNPNTSLYERPPGFTVYTAPSTRYSGITIHGMEWVAGDDSMRVRIRFDGSAPPAGADTIRADMTWDGLVQLTGDLVVAPGANVTVTDSSRVIFKARDDRHSGGKDADRVELVTRGRLAVQGTSSARARFTSSRDNAFINFRTAGEMTAPSPGDYYGLRFLDTDPGQPLSLLDHASFSYPRFAVEVDSISGDLWHCQFSDAESADVFVGRDHRVSEYYRWFLDAPTRVMVKESDPYGTGSDALRVEMEFNGQFYTERPAGVSSQDSVWFVSAAATPAPGDWAGIKAQDVYARAGVKDASIGHAVDPLSYSGIIYTAEVENSRFHHYSNIGFFDYWSRAIVRGCSFDGSGSSTFAGGADTGIKAVHSIPTIENNTVSWHKSHGIKLEWAKVACANLDADPNAVEDSSFVQGNTVTGNGEDSDIFVTGTGIGITWGCVKRHVRLVDNIVTAWRQQGVSLFQCAETRLACNVIEDNFRGVQHSRNISEASGQVVRLRANELRSSLDTNLWADDVVKLRLYDAASPNYAKQNAFRPDSLGPTTVSYNIDHQDGSLSVLDTRNSVWWSASGTLLDVSDSTYVRARIRGHQSKVDITSPQDPLGLCDESSNVAVSQHEARFDQGGAAEVSTEASGERLALAVQPRTNRGSEFALSVPPGGSQGVRLRIYDVRGRLVASVLIGGRPGRETATWDERDLSGRLVASGVYFARLEAGRASVHRKLVVVR